MERGDHDRERGDRAVMARLVQDVQNLRRERDELRAAIDKRVSQAIKTTRMQMDEDYRRVLASMIDTHKREEIEWAKQLGQERRAHEELRQQHQALAAEHETLRKREKTRLVRKERSDAYGLPSPKSISDSIPNLNLHMEDQEDLDEDDDGGSRSSPADDTRSINIPQPLRQAISSKDETSLLDQLFDALSGPNHQGIPLNRIRRFIRDAGLLSRKMVLADIDVHLVKHTRNSANKRLITRDSFLCVLADLAEQLVEDGILKIPSTSARKRKPRRYEDLMFSRLAMTDDDDGVNEETKKQVLLNALTKALLQHELCKEQIE